MNYSERFSQLSQDEGFSTAVSKSLRFLFDAAAVTLFPPTSYHGVELDVSRFELRPKISLRKGNFENGTLHLIDERFPSDIPVIELGGGAGIVTCYLDRFSQAAVYTLEPNPSIHPTLNRTIELNNCDPHVYQAAYSSTDDEITLSLPNEYWSASTQFSDGEATTIVDGMSLESIRAEHGLDEFCLVANAEGAEYDLIENELNVLAEHCSHMIIGFHEHDGDDPSKSVLLDRLREKGFVLEDISGKEKHYLWNETLTA